MTAGTYQDKDGRLVRLSITENGRYMLTYLDTGQVTFL